MKELEAGKQYIRVRDKELDETRQKLQEEFETMGQKLLKQCQEEMRKAENELKEKMAVS
jgi:exonuclease VII small subunit